MSKAVGRLGKNYRIMWVNDSNNVGNYNLPITPEKVAQANLGFLEGTPVDACVCCLGWNAGYTVDYPTEVPGMEFIGDRFNAGAAVGHVSLWRYAESMRRLWRYRVTPAHLRPNLDHAAAAAIESLWVDPNTEPVLKAIIERNIT